jgi:hypothetical protein
MPLLTMISPRNNHHAMEAYVEWRYSSTRSEPLHAVDISG